MIEDRGRLAAPATLVGAVALGLLLGAIWWTQVRTVGRAEAPAQVPPATFPAAGAAGAAGDELGPAAPSLAVRREARAEPVPMALAAPREVVLSGIVRCALTRGPLDSTVELAQHATHTDAGGRFTLRATLEESRILCIASEGYESLRLPIAQEQTFQELATILLEPAAQVLLRVRDARGLAVEGAEVELVGLAEPSVWGARRGRSLGLTDAQGRLGARIGRPERVLALHGERCSEAVDVRPGSGEVLLVLGEGSGSRFGLRDLVSGAPLAGVDLRVVELEGYPPLAFELRTAADGRIPRPLPPGRYRLEEARKALDFAPTPGALPNPFSSSNSSRLSFALVTIHPGGTQVWLEAALRGRRSIVAYDRSSGERLEPLYAWFSFFEEPPFVDRPRWVRMGGENVVAADGELSLYELQALFTSPSSLRLELFVPGYQPAFIDDARTRLQPAPEPHRIELERAPERSLRLLEEGGSPYPHRVHVREGPHGALVHEGLVDARGLLGPFGWTGGDLALRSGRSSHSPLLVEVPAVELERAAEVEVVLHGAGAIEVLVPEGAAPRLYASSGAGDHQAGILRGGRLRFEGLRAGSFELGPLEWLETVSLREARGLETYPVRVEAGRTTRVAWHSDWAPPGVIEGRVLAPGMEGLSLWVVPRFDPPEVPLGHTGRAARFRVREDGRYELRGLSMRPTRLMFAYADERGTLVPLGSSLPGADARLSCTRVLLAVRGAPAGSEACVRCVPVVDGVRSLGAITRCGPLDRPLDLGWIPSETPFLELGWGGRQRVDLNLAPGETLTVELELDGGPQGER